MFCSKCILKHTEMKHEVIQISPKIDEMKKMIELSRLAYVKFIADQKEAAEKAERAEKEREAAATALM